MHCHFSSQANSNTTTNILWGGKQLSLPTTRNIPNPYLHWQSNFFNYSKIDVYFRLVVHNKQQQNQNHIKILQLIMSILILTSNYGNKNCWLKNNKCFKKSIFHLLIFLHFKCHYCILYQGTAFTSKFRFY